MRAQKVKAGRHVAIYWDGSIRVEVGVELQAPFSEQGEVVRSATPAGLVASTTHLGPYAGLGAAHDAVHQWCRAAITVSPVRAGRFTDTGSRSGMRNPPAFGRTFTIW